MVLRTYTKGLGGVIAGGFLAVHGRCRRAADYGDRECGALPQGDKEGGKGRFIRVGVVR